jgi:membrane protease YdiL (CAAX protease family)
MSLGSSPDGRIRPIWRATIYYVAGTWLLFPLLDLVFEAAARSFHVAPGLSAGNIGFGELRNLVAALVCTGAFAAYEHRRVDSYGLPIESALARQTFEGAAAGFVLAGAVAVGMVVLGGMQIDGLALTGRALAFSAVAWFAANVCVGLAEEAWFRGYLQQTLWKASGSGPRRRSLR